MVEWEYKVGPLTINFRVLLEPKGFLRIILFVSYRVYWYCTYAQKTSCDNYIVQQIYNYI